MHQLDFERLLPSFDEVLAAVVSCPRNTLRQSGAHRNLDFTMCHTHALPCLCALSPSLPPSPPPPRLSLSHTQSLSLSLSPSLSPIMPGPQWKWASANFHTMSVYSMPASCRPALTGRLHAFKSRSEPSGYTNWSFTGGNPSSVCEHEPASDVGAESGWARETGSSRGTSTQLQRRFDFVELT